MAWKEAIQEEFQDCLSLFPELKSQKIELVIRISQGLAGLKARDVNDQDLIVLLVPPLLHDKPKAIRPILLHELSHFVDLENPDRIFMERADKKSKQLWRKLQEDGQLACETEKHKRAES